MLFCDVAFEVGVVSSTGVNKKVVEMSWDSLYMLLVVSMALYKWLVSLLSRHTIHNDTLIYIIQKKSYCGDNLGPRQKDDHNLSPCA